MNHHDDPKRALHKAIWLPCLVFYASVPSNYTQNNPVGLNDSLDRSQLIMNWENELGIIKLAFRIVRAKQTGANC